jgi:hypothetical protein
MSEPLEQGFVALVARLADLESRLGGLLGELSGIRADAEAWQAAREVPTPPAPSVPSGDAAIRAILDTLVDKWRPEAPPQPEPAAILPPEPVVAAEPVPPPEPVPAPEPVAAPAPPAADLEATMILPASPSPRPSVPPAERAAIDADKTMVIPPSPPAPPKAPPPASGEITMETIILTAPPPRPAPPPPAAPPQPPPAAPPPADDFDLAATVILPPRKPGDPGRR